MSEAESAALMLVSRLLEYPDKAWFSSLCRNLRGSLASALSQQAMKQSRLFAASK